VKLDHLTLVIQPYGTELELAETCDFNDLLQMYPMGTPLKIRNLFFSLGGWTTGTFHCGKRSGIQVKHSCLKASSHEAT